MAPLADKALLKLSTLMVFTQSAIVCTGALVRITGSGLGCSTWPECTPGSYTPTPDQPEAPLHAWIEFGNRLLTFVLLINALALMFTILKSGKRELRRLGALQILGILAQGVLGGITVLTALNPATVAAHFLLSIILIAGALSLRQRAHGKSPIEITLIPLVTKLIWLHLLLTSLVLIAGTIVTGSGPHAGDSAAERFNLDSRTMAWIHADLVIALLGVSIALLIAIRLGLTGQARQVLSGRIQIFLIVALAQGSIGYIQYFTKLPEALVAAHIIGSIAVWLSAWNLFISSNLGANLIARKGL
ncbi:MAG TPA: COX15/CtaA family protein [Candidatus Nanopelagicaceae bacterium]|nr:COX15/CtaA family protein [Candidatus Nanopelagicaceae bacterium]